MIPRLPDGRIDWDWVVLGGTFFVLLPGAAVVMAVLHWIGWMR